MPARLLPLLGPQPQSGAVLAAHLGIGRARLHGLAHELLEQGYPLLVSRRGYALESGTPAPQLLDLGGRAYRYLGTLDSTQDELRRWAADPLEPAPPGALVLAERQTAGRGRRGRIWEGGGRNLTFSLLLPPGLDLASLGLLPLAAGVAVCQVTRALAGVGGLKWPNDLLAPDGRKLAGLLLEADLRGEEVARAVLGLGLNVASAPAGAACLHEFRPGLPRAQLLSRPARRPRSLAGGPRPGCAGCLAQRLGHAGAAGGTPDPGGAAAWYSPGHRPGRGAAAAYRRGHLAAHRRGRRAADRLARLSPAFRTQPFRTCFQRFKGDPMTQYRSPLTPFPTLARTALPRPGLLTDTLLVLGGAALVALLAQVEIQKLPVPWTLQTLGVLLVGAVLGWQRGGLALLTYILAGAVGLPVLSGGGAGLAKVVGPTGGYLAGFVLAAALVGWLVQRFGLDRRVGGAALAMLAGNVVIYALGLPWLSHVIPALKGQALLAAGLTPFLLGDALKLMLAALLLPGAWTLLRR